MKAIILAGEGAVLSRNRDLPSCLQPLMGGTNLLDQQIRTLNLFGIPNEDILIVVGIEGNWATENAQAQLRKHSALNIVVNEQNIATTSEYSFYSALKKLNPIDCTVVINSDAIFDLRHLERLVERSFPCALLTRKPVSINDRGIRLQVSKGNYLSIVRSTFISEFPWLLYAGLAILSPETIEKLLTADPVLNTDGLIYSFDISLGIHTFNYVEYHSLESYSSFASRPARDLTGGSFAKLERKHLVRKEAHGPGFEKLTWEIDWLLGLPESLQPWFPVVVDTQRNESSVWYDMPWYDLPNLRKNILTGKYNSEDALALTGDVLSFMFGEVYPNVINDNVDFEWVIDKHIRRVKDRVQETYENCPPLRGIIRAQKVIINGRVYRNIPECLLIIASKLELLVHLSPKQLRMIHGDLHFQNILVGPTETNTGFILADPRGELNGSDLFYDMGKLWHSFNGLYDLIHTDLFTLKEDDCGPDYVSFCFLFPNKELLKTYASIKGLSHVMLEEFSLIRNDPYWLPKTLFTEAMHFSSVMAFHIRNDSNESRAKALYLKGVQLLNEFIAVSECHSYESDTSVINRLELVDWKSSLHDDYLEKSTTGLHGT